MYKVYGAYMTRAFRVYWALEELGLSYDRVDAGPQSPEIRAVSPPGKVPALEVDGTLLTDSTAILTYLADKHGGLTYPAGTLDRARQDSVTMRWLDEVDAVLWTAARHRFALPKEQRVEAVIPSLAWEMERNMARLEDSFEGPYLAGDMFTIADIIAVHCLGWAFSAKLSAGGDKLKAYGKTLRNRPAFQTLASRMR